MRLTSLSKRQVIKLIIAQLEEQEDEISIKTGLLDNYAVPEIITQEPDKKEYYPDIQTISKDGETNIYEIELSTNISAVKWFIFSLFTKNRRGELFVVVPEHNLSATEEGIIENGIKNIKLKYVLN